MKDNLLIDNASSMNIKDMSFHLSLSFIRFILIKYNVTLNRQAYAGEGGGGVDLLRYIVR